MTDQERFMALRQRLFKMIEKAVKEYSHHKSYEGALEVAVCYPNYFEDSDSPEYVCIRLDCYVLGWGRHYKFDGNTFAEALDRFEATLDEFEAELEGEE